MRTELVLRTSRENLEKNLSSVASKIRAALEGNNLLPKGAILSFKSSPYNKGGKLHFMLDDLSLLQICFPYAYT